MINRAPKGVNAPYFRLRRETAQDTRLSLEALGALVYFLSKSDDWNAHKRDLMRQWGIGRTKAERIMCELRDAGYARKRHDAPCKDERGQWTFTKTVINERPVAQKPSTGDPRTGEPSAENGATTIRENTPNEENKPEKENIHQHHDPRESTDPRHPLSAALPPLYKHDDDVQSISDTGEFIPDEQEPEQPASENSGISEQERLLRMIGVHEPHCTEFDHVPTQTIRHWRRVAEAFNAQNVPGFVLSKLRAGATPPPGSAPPPSPVLDRDEQRIADNPDVAAYWGEIQREKYASGKYADYVNC